MASTQSESDSASKNGPDESQQVLNTKSPSSILRTSVAATRCVCHGLWKQRRRRPTMKSEKQKAGRCGSVARVGECPCARKDAKTVVKSLLRRATGTARLGSCAMVSPPPFHTLPTRSASRSRLTLERAAVQQGGVPAPRTHLTHAQHAAHCRYKGLRRTNHGPPRPITSDGRVHPRAASTRGPRVRPSRRPLPHLACRPPRRRPHAVRARRQTTTATRAERARRPRGRVASRRRVAGPRARAGAHIRRRLVIARRRRDVAARCRAKVDGGRRRHRPRRKVALEDGRLASLHHLDHARALGPAGLRAVVVAHLCE